MIKKTILYLSLLSILACQREQVTKSGLANDDFFLKNNGQTMPIKVAGNIQSNKYILIVHGGPGGSSFDYRDKHVVSDVESQFAMVYWDQRYAGYSQGNIGSTNINQFNDDIKKVILLLKHRYGNQIEVFIMGHSWGGFLTPYFLSQNSHQDLVKGWIQVDGAHNYLLNDSLTKEMLLHYGNIEIHNNRNEDWWQEVVSWCQTNDFKGWENSAKLNGFAHEAEQKFTEITNESYELIGKKKPTLAYKINLFNSGLKKIDQQANLQNSSILKSIKTPIFMMWGKYDFVCPPELLVDIEKNIGSTDIEKHIFQFSGHSPMANETIVFWKELIKWVNQH